METNTANQTQTSGSPFTPRYPLPNSDVVLILGIFSIPGCWCFGIVGLALGIIALVLSKDSSRLYLQEPGKFSESSYNNLKAGKICAIIGIALSGFFIILYIIKILILGVTLGALSSWLPLHQYLK